MAFVPQIKIPATYMRGGTSKGVFFNLQDLPEAAQLPGAARDALGEIAGVTFSPIEQGFTPNDRNFRADYPGLESHQ